MGLATEDLVIKTATGAVDGKALDTTTAVVLASIFLFFFFINMILTAWGQWLTHVSLRDRAVAGRLPLLAYCFSFFIYFLAAWNGAAVWTTPTLGLEVPGWMFIPAAIGFFLVDARDIGAIGPLDTTEAKKTGMLAKDHKDWTAAISGMVRGNLSGILSAFFMLGLMFGTWDVRNDGTVSNWTYFGLMFAAVMYLWLSCTYFFSAMSNLWAIRKLGNKGKGFGWMMIYVFVKWLIISSVGICYAIGPNLSFAVTGNKEITIGYGVVYLCVPFFDLVLYAIMGWRHVVKHRGDEGYKTYQHIVTKKAAAGAKWNNKTRAD